MRSHADSEGAQATSFTHLAPPLSAAPDDDRDSFVARLIPPFRHALLMHPSAAPRKVRVRLPETEGERGKAEGGISPFALCFSPFAGRYRLREKVKVPAGSSVRLEFGGK